MVNKKALWTFLILTFALTIGLLAGAKLLGFSLEGQTLFMSQLVIAGAMFVPALCAIFTQKFVVKKSLRELGFKFGPWRMYAKAYGLILSIFIINYGLVWVFIQKPDFSLGSFMDQFGIAGGLPISAPMMILAFSFMTLIAAPIVNMIPSLGEEIGWRGFLLPALEPLGKIKAMIISGAIWALWHTPMILILGFMYGQQAWPGILIHFVLVTSLGIWMGYLWFKTRSTILAAFIHAVFNANAYGIWTMIFVPGDELIVGGAGIIGASLCLIVALATLYQARRTKFI